MFDEALLFQHLRRDLLKAKEKTQASNFLSVSKSSGGEHHAPCLYMAACHRPQVNNSGLSTGPIAKSCMISFQASEVSLEGLYSCTSPVEARKSVMKARMKFWKFLSQAVTSLTKQNSWRHACTFSVSPNFVVANKLTPRMPHTRLASSVSGSNCTGSATRAE